MCKDRKYTKPIQVKGDDKNNYGDLLLRVALQTQCRKLQDVLSYSVLGAEFASSFEFDYKLEREN